MMKFKIIKTYIVSFTDKELTERFDSTTPEELANEITERCEVGNYDPEEDDFIPVSWKCEHIS